MPWSVFEIILGVFSIWMLNKTVYWSSWPVSARIYGLSCWLLIVLWWLKHLILNHFYLRLWILSLCYMYMYIYFLYMFYCHVTRLRLYQIRLVLKHNIIGPWVISDLWDLVSNCPCSFPTYPSVESSQKYLHSRITSAGNSSVCHGENVNKHNNARCLAMFSIASLCT